MTGVLHESLRSNDVFAGGLVLLLTGAALSILYRLVPLLAGALLRRFTVTMEIRDEDVFAWLGDWLAQQQYGLTCRRVSVQLLHVAMSGVPRSTSVLVFAPGRGMHVFRREGRWYLLERRLDREAGAGVALQPREHYVLHTYGVRQDALREIIGEAARLHEQRRRGRTSVFCPDRQDGWRRLEMRVLRPLDSVVLARGVAERLVSDLAWFLDSAGWYHRLGIPYRRGYLLHGPPGCGKSSFAGALAAHFGLDIYIVGLAAQEMSDERLAADLARTRPRSLLLLEDVDAAFTGRGGAADAASRVTFSGLLNALDGLVAQEDRVCVLTTNHVERLDPALIRPGRIDVRQYIGLADAEQARRIFLRFFPDAREQAEGAAQVAAAVPVAPALLQNLLLQQRSDACSALSALRLLAGGTVIETR